MIALGNRLLAIISNMVTLAANTVIPNSHNNDNIQWLSLAHVIGIFDISESLKLRSLCIVSNDGSVYIMITVKLGILWNFYELDLIIRCWNFVNSWF